jgi:hypothetical protein
MSATREAIDEAVFAYLTGATSPFLFSSRRLVHWTNQTVQPALFYRGIGEHHERQRGAGQPQIVTLHRQIWLYVNTGAPDSTPSSALNPLLDAIDALLAPNPYEPGRLTLGGLVQEVWREGETIVTEGELGTQAVAICPLHILAVLSPY